MKLLYTAEAVHDLKRLRAFIELQNPTAVAKVAATLLQGIAKLQTLPRLGRKVTQAPNPDRVRDLSVDMYRVRYLVGADEIHILRIWHKREDWPNA